MIIYFNDTNNITKKYNLNFFEWHQQQSLLYKKLFNGLIEIMKM